MGGGSGTASAVLKQKRAHEQAWDKLESGRFLLEQGQPDKALKVLLKAAKLAPSLPVIHLFLASAYFDLERWSEAADAYRREAEVSAQDKGLVWMAHHNLGVIAWRQERFTEAVNELLIAVNLAPDDARPNWMLGLMYTELGSYTEAVKYLRSTLRLDPSLPMLHYSLAECYSGLGLLSEAIQECHAELAASKEHDTAVYALLAQMHAKTGSFHEMLRACQRLTQLSPNDVQAHLSVGDLCVGAGRWESANRAYRKAVQLNPDCAEAYLGLARMYIGRKRRMEAIALAKKALELGHKEARAFLDDLDNREQATEWWPSDALGEAGGATA
jgi:tetratricopeptide (TPR) repeat protein